MESKKNTDTGQQDFVNPLLDAGQHNSTKRLKKFISFSGGVESTTMCLLYGKGATAIWCDTGNEEPELYERIDFVEQIMNVIHNGDFLLKRLYPEVIVKGKNCVTINEAALEWKFFPSPTARWCTKSFKIEPIDKFLAEQGECELLLGFNADEEPGTDRTGNFMKCKNVSYKYPLYDDGITRDECEEMLHEYGLHPQFPVYMGRGGCTNCFYKTRNELKAKYVFNKNGFLKDEQFEKDLQDKRAKFYYINMNAKGSYSQIRQEVENEIKQWGVDEIKKMYSKIGTHKPCGAFCHR